MIHFNIKQFYTTHTYRETPGLWKLKYCNLLTLTGQGYHLGKMGWATSKDW
jgi:hypothetical protein